MHQNIINNVSYASFPGPGRHSTINASISGKSIYWSVKPATKWSYQFNGKVQLRYHSGFKRDATLVGTASSMDVKYYNVMPDVTKSFRAN